MMRNAHRIRAVACLVVWATVQPVRADDWPQFRGPDRNAISAETGLLRQWPEGGPKVLWSVEACEGYASAAIHSGRVYFNDYDRKGRAWLVRCVTLEEGKEVWRFVGFAVALALFFGNQK